MKPRGITYNGLQVNIATLYAQVARDALRHWGFVKVKGRWRWYGVNHLAAHCAVEYFRRSGMHFTNKRCYEPDGLAINLKNNRYTKPDPVRTIAKIDERMGFEPVGPKEILSTIYDVLKELGIEDTARGDINKAQTWANSQSALDASPKPTTPGSSRPKNRAYRKRAAARSGHVRSSSRPSQPGSAGR